MLNCPGIKDEGEVFTNYTNHLRPKIKQLVTSSDYRILSLPTFHR